jgi:hypothetical protein
MGQTISNLLEWAAGIGTVIFMIWLFYLMGGEEREVRRKALRRKKLIEENKEKH